MLNINKAPKTAKSLSKKMVELNIAEQKIGLPISEELRQLYIENNPHDGYNLTDKIALNMICTTALLSAGKLSRNRN